MALHAYRVRFLNPAGTKLSWVYVCDNLFPSFDSITPELVSDVKNTILTAHGNLWRDISILEVSHIDRCLVSKGLGSPRKRGEV